MEHGSSFGSEHGGRRWSCGSVCIVSGLGRSGYSPNPYKFSTLYSIGESLFTVFASLTYSYHYPDDTNEMNTLNIERG